MKVVVRVGSTRVTQILAGVDDGGVDVASLPQRLVSACARALPVTGVALLLMTDVRTGRNRRGH